VLGAYGANPEVQAELRRRAAESREHASAVEELDRPSRSVAMDRLRQQLLDEILPVQWTGASLTTPASNG